MITPESAPSPKKFSSIRKWVTPLTMGTFLLTAGTGLGLFFEVEWGLVKPIHEWLSLTLLAGALLHLWDHRNSVLKHLSGTWGKAFVAAGALILIGALLPITGGEEEEEDEHRPNREIAQTLERIPLASLATARNVPVDSLVIRLNAAGIANATPSSTVEQLAGRDQHLKTKAMAAIFPGSKNEEEEDED
ncbi:MAG: hypothetical protein RL318_461 [Fibrobacterota bacterium]|jgi:hypothetical protein